MYFNAIRKRFYLSFFSKSFFGKTHVAEYSNVTTTNLHKQKVLNDAYSYLSLKSAPISKWYEDLMGVSDVKQSQQHLLEAERNFVNTQESRREKQKQLDDIQLRLRDIHLELDKTSRGEDRYLHLLTQEHALIKEEKFIHDDIRRVERAERHCFGVLSNRLRESHEHERLRVERAKYLSSLFAIGFGVFGVSSVYVVNRLRRNDLKKTLAESTPTDLALQQTLLDLSTMFQKLQQQTGTFVGDLKIMLNGSNADGVDATNNTPTLTAQRLNNFVSNEEGQAIKSTLAATDDKLEKDFVEIKKLIATEKGFELTGDGSIVYVGPDMINMLERTERNLEMKLKMNSLLGVVITYAALALTVPVLYAVFRG